MKIRYPFIGQYPITQRFGENPSIYARFGKPGHNGVDWGTPTGTPILSAADGKIIRVGYDENGYGNYVVIQHDGFQTLYAHLSSVVVSPNANVRAGDLVGYSGSTGYSTGPHLHFELRIPGHPNSYNKGEVDPLPYLQASAQPAGHVGTDAALDYVKLAKGNEYVNIRSGPGMGYAIIGKLLPEDEPKKVLDIQGEWVCILKWRGVEFWVNYRYLERA
jgi:hypothetical protein